MSEDKFFALATVLISGFFSFVVAVSTLYFTKRREDQAFQRQLARERIERTRIFYQDVLTLLAYLARNDGKINEETRKEVARIKAAMPLQASAKVREWHGVTTTALDNYMKIHRKLSPTDMGDGTMMITSNLNRKEDENYADVLWKDYLSALECLSESMVSHLEQLEHS